MKTLLFSLSILSVFAFTSRLDLNSPNITNGEMVKQIIEYNDGTISTKIVSIEDVQNLDFPKKSDRLKQCTYETFSGQCSSTASTCDAAFAAFVTCLCRAGYTRWCQ